MDAVMTRLDEITKTLNELKSIVTNQIFGIGDSDDSNTPSMGILEKKTLREIVEETQFQVIAINKKIMNEEKRKEIPLKQKYESRLKQTVVKESSDESTEESAAEFPVVEIERKTIDEERNWMKVKFNEVRKMDTVEDGESLRGTTIEEISSLTTLPTNVRTSCTIKLSNFLDSTLTDPQYKIWVGSKNSGPLEVAGHQTEVITFVGSANRCSFLCSFAINQLLRLYFRCCVCNNGDIKFGIGFIPAAVPIDWTLHNFLMEIPAVPDVWMINKECSELPVELFVSHGNLLVRGYMSNGPRSVVQVEIIEIISEIPSSRSRRETKKRIVDGKNFSCNIEIANCLNVPLRNSSKFYLDREKNDFTSLEVLPFRREQFCMEDKTKLEAMFSYEIDSTDLAIVVALKVEPNLNLFAAAFVQRPAVNGAKELEALMDPNQWKTHYYRTYANANEGVQLIQMGNIRAEISMLEGEQSNLKISVFAV